MSHANQQSDNYATRNVVSGSAISQDSTVVVSGSAISQDSTANVVDMKDVTDEIPGLDADRKIGSELPRLVFADDQYAIIQDVFGLYRYSLSERRINGFCDLVGLDYCNIKVSQDNNDIFIFPSETIQVDGTPGYVPNPDDNVYVYNIKNNTVLRRKKTDVEGEFMIFKELPESKTNDTKKYHVLYGYEFTEGTYSFMALSKDFDWTCDGILYVEKKGDVTKVYKVFKDSVADN